MAWFVGRTDGQRRPKKIPRVLNIRHGVNTAGAVNVMRSGPFGNKFRIGWDGDRKKVLALHQNSLLSDYDLLGKVERLRGCDLVCCCKPKRCHADLLFVLANTDQDIGDTC